MSSKMSERGKRELWAARIIVDFSPCGTSTCCRECGSRKSRYVSNFSLVLSLSLSVILCYDFVCRLEPSLFCRVRSCIATHVLFWLYFPWFIFLLQILVYRWLDTAQLKGKPSFSSNVNNLWARDPQQAILCMLLRQNIWHLVRPCLHFTGQVITLLGAFSKEKQIFWDRFWVFWLLCSSITVVKDHC
jgi:hypothetical protein